MSVLVSGPCCSVSEQTARRAKQPERRVVAQQAASPLASSWRHSPLHEPLLRRPALSRNNLPARGAQLLPSAASSAIEASTQAPSSSQTSKCPVHQLSNVLSGASANAVSATSAVIAPTAAPAALRPIPGPPPLSLEALKDVSIIFFEGLHVAMLRFSQKYGPICRFANPASLNGATSWVFLNSPDAIQHVAASNVRNYGRRYLPDIYAYVTHGKGLLGSQDEYNARHRRLCSGPFRNRAQLQRFSSVVVDRSQRLADIWLSAATAATAGGAAGAGAGPGSLVTDISTQTQRLTLDIVGLVAFSHDFGQVERVR
ncbi:hypothetical protein Agub_g6133, partial [Astrephomene gubernaculifera]